MRTAGETRTEQEQYVLECVAAGEEANLRRKFGPEEENRELRASFLEDLLTGLLPDVKPHRRGIRIRAAVITGDLDLEQAQVPHPVQIWHSRFQGPANFREAHFHKTFSLYYSVFEQKADFYRVRVDGEFSCQQATFEGATSFQSGDLRWRFGASDAKFKSTDEANFNGLKVEEHAFFRDAEFQGPVDFARAEIKLDFDAERAKFESKDKANFNGLKVGEHAFFEGAEFQGPVDFGSADIKGQFAARCARFESTETANFAALEVGDTAFFRDAEFQGPVDFRFLRVGINFEADGAQFHFRDEAPPGPDQLPEVTARFMKVGQRGYFRNASFAGRLSLAGSHFLDLLISAPALEELDLEGAKIERELKIDATLKREGLPDREDMEITELKCQNLRVLGPATLRRVKIDLRADFLDARLQRVNLLGVKWPDRDQGGRLDLDGLIYHAVTVRDRGEAPERHEAPDQERRHRQEEEGKKLLEWLRDSRFNTENYNQLEAYWQRCGHRRNADKVHIAGKKRELDLREPGPGKLAIRFFWQYLTGFGREAWRVILAALALIFLGVIFFTPPTLHKDNWLQDTNFYKAAIAGTGSAHSRDPNPAREAASSCPLPNWQNLALRGLISVDRLLPSWVDLGVARDWRPDGREISGCALFYWNFHRVWGWILVVIGLAALSTRFK